MNWTLAAAALGIGIVVGLTGMGGGALMTPMLVLFFGVPPLTAVSSDLVASAVMKPVGSFVHLRHGTVRLDLVRWLCVGSVPAAFAGVLVARSLGHGAAVEDLIQKALGVALVIAAMGLFLRAYLRMAERARRRDGRRLPDPKGRPQRARPAAADGARRRRRRARGRYDVGRVGIADHHRADGPVPDAAGQRTRGHRPRAGSPAGRISRDRPPDLR